MTAILVNTDASEGSLHWQLFSTLTMCFSQTFIWIVWIKRCRNILGYSINQVSFRIRLSLKYTALLFTVNPMKGMEAIKVLVCLQSSQYKPDCGSPFWTHSFLWTMSIFKFTNKELLKKKKKLGCVLVSCRCVFGINQNKVRCPCDSSTHSLGHRKCHFIALKTTVEKFCGPPPAVRVIKDVFA